MPVGPYEDFAACVAANQDKDDPEAYCASLEQETDYEETSNMKVEKARAMLRAKSDAFGREYRTVHSPVELRAPADPAERPTTLAGHAAVFDQEINMWGMFRERIAPGAFRKTIREADVRHLFNHDPNWVLARTRNGTLRLAEDEVGLAFEATLNADDPQAQTVIAVVQRGDVDQSSFAFRVIKEEWTEPGDDADGALPLRVIKEAQLYDTSTVTFPAYETTDSYLRAIGLDLVTHGLGLEEGEDATAEVLRVLALGEEPRAELAPTLTRAAGVLETLATRCAPTPEPEAQTPAEPTNITPPIDTSHTHYYQPTTTGALTITVDVADGNEGTRAAEEALEEGDQLNAEEARQRLRLRARLTAREKGLTL